MSSISVRHVIPLDECTSFDPNMSCAPVPPPLVQKRTFISPSAGSFEMDGSSSATPYNVPPSDIQSQNPPKRVSFVATTTNTNNYSVLVIEQAMKAIKTARRSMRAAGSKVIKSEACNVNKSLIAYQQRSQYRKRTRQVGRTALKVEEGPLSCVSHSSHVNDGCKRCVYKTKHHILSTMTEDDENSSMCSIDATCTSDTTCQVDNTNRNDGNHRTDGTYGLDDEDTMMNLMLDHEEQSLVWKQACRMKRLALLMQTIDSHQKMLFTELAACRMDSAVMETNV